MKKKLKILFRTAGGTAKNKELGMGHIFRCINLARELKNQNLFFAIEDYGGLKKFFMQHDYSNIHFLKSNIDFKKDIQKTTDIIKKNEIDLIIVDKFGVEKKFIKTLKKITKTVVISDLKLIDFDADLIINGFIGFKNIKKKNHFNSMCLLGPSYQILHKNFEKNNANIKKNITLLATFGGFDEKEAYLLLIQELIKKYSNIKTKIILGPATNPSKKLDKLIDKNKNSIQILSETNDMVNHMSKSQFGICSGGLTTYEFASMKIPFGIICQNNHQVLTANQWQKKGIAINLGKINKTSSKKISRFLEKITNDAFPLIQTSLVDGYGAKRVSKVILEMFLKDRK
jgi:UDP-2,4-diacetamido-2,4,6-trideoxy-beta-L-altropyranose hydrolase